MPGRCTDPRHVPGVRHILKSPPAARAALHVVGDGLLLSFVELLIQQPLQLVEGHTGLHRSIL
jgi:hypothetical protein